jgi:hypothetical protein
MKTVSFFAKNLSSGLLWLLLGLVLFSCEPEPIGIELPPHEPKLVIATQMLPKNRWVVQVSRSFSSLAGKGDELTPDSSFLQGLVVDHALVQLSGNGHTATLQRVGPGLYLCRRNLQQFGPHYSLFVKDSVSGLECTAATEMMPAVSFSSVKPVLNPGQKDTTVTLEFELDDPGPERNFFMISYAGASRKNMNSQQGFGALNPLEEQLLLFSDANFTGGHFAAKERLQVKASDTLVVALSQISEPYYRYLELYRKSHSLMNQLTGEPINLPTNIQNGYGFFSAHNPTIKFFKLKE